MLKPFYAAILAGLLLGCISVLNAQEQPGKIVIFREGHFATGQFKPTLNCDNSELARIENATYFEVTAPAGLHLCNVETSGRPPLEVNVESGRPAYVHVELISGIQDRAMLANTTEAEYNKQKSKLKALGEWTRNSLTPKPQLVSQSKPDKANGDLGTFGDLAVSVTKLTIAPNKNASDRSTFEAYVSTKNAGTGVICAYLSVTLNATFGLQYRGTSEQAPRMQEMLPGESSEGVFRFDIKNGVQPTELVFTLNDFGNTPKIRCGWNPPKEALPTELHFDITKLPTQ